MTAHTGRDRAEQACVDGESALQRHDGAAAEKQFHEALALVEGDGSEAALRVAARAHTGAGRVRLATGELDAAVAEFERARSLRPHAAGPLHWLGCAAAHRGDLAAAETHLTAALDCAVPHPRSLIQRAYVHARAGHPEAARTDLLTASRTAPLDEEAQWTLAALSGRPAKEVALRLRAAAVGAGRAGARSGAVTGAAGSPPPGAAGMPRGGDRAASLLEAAWSLDQEPGGFAPLYAAILVRGEGGGGGEDVLSGQDDPDGQNGRGRPSGESSRNGHGEPRGESRQDEPGSQRVPGGHSGTGEQSTPSRRSEPHGQGRHSSQNGQGEPRGRDEPGGQSEHSGPGGHGGQTERSGPGEQSKYGSQGGTSRSESSREGEPRGRNGLGEPSGQRKLSEPSGQDEPNGQREQSRQTQQPGQSPPSGESEPDGQRGPGGQSERGKPSAQAERSGQSRAPEQGEPRGRSVPSSCEQGVQSRPGEPDGQGEHSRQGGRSGQDEPCGKGEQDRPGEPCGQNGRGRPGGQGEPCGQTDRSGERGPDGGRQGSVKCARRDVAVALLREAARRAPADHRVTHSLAIALLNSQATARRSHWEPCVAAWASLLYDERFWERVRSTAARRYGVPVERSLVPGLRAGLREFLERRMPDGDTGTRVAPGPLLQREADAAKLLAGVGGLPSAEEGGAPLLCGPLRIAELDRTAEFGAFAAAQEDRLLQESVAASTNGATGAESTPAPPAYAPITYTSLTYAFSELGLAQLLLGQNKPADALAALTELRCPGCRKRGGPGSGAVCEPDCARFDELNPGYAGLPDRHRRLALDARGLALEARLSMGRAELTAARPDFRAAAAYWRRALVHSRELERYRETQTAIVDMALGAARDAHRVGRLSLAVDTLETTRSVIGANERGRLEGQLARVLADRGISVANDETSLLDEPAADLRRSVAFNPHLLRAQVSLGIVLRGLASARWSSGSLSGARDTLREAVDQLTTALVHFPADPDLEEQREAAVADLDHVMWQPDESGR